MLEDRPVTPELLAAASDERDMRALGFVLPRDAAAALDRAERTIRTWERRGQIRSHRVNGVLYVNVYDVARRNGAQRRVAASRRSDVLESRKA